MINEPKGLGTTHLQNLAQKLTQGERCPFHIYTQKEPNKLAMWDKFNDLKNLNYPQGYE